MWDVSTETSTSVAPEQIWALWEDPARWSDWNEQIAAASMDDFAEGSTARIRFKRSPIAMRFSIRAIQPGTLFVDETRLPGARMGHEHRVERTSDGCMICHRLYVVGPLEKVYVALLGRQMRSSLNSFGPREAELAAASMRP